MSLTCTAVHSPPRAVFTPRADSALATPRDIREYERAAKKKNDPTGAYADETLPTLRKHLDTAQSLMGNVGSGKR
jgi:hypothetical protein